MENFKEGEVPSYKLQAFHVTGTQTLYNTMMVPIAPQQIKTDVFSGICQGQAWTFIQNTPQRRK